MKRLTVILATLALAGCGGPGDGTSNPRLSEDAKYAKLLCEEGFLQSGNWDEAAEWAQGANTFEEDNLDDREIADGCHAARSELKPYGEHSSTWLRGYVYGSDSRTCNRVAIANRITWWFKPRSAYGMPRDQYPAFQREFIDGCRARLGLQQLSRDARYVRFLCEAGFLETGNWDDAARWAARHQALKQDKEDMLDAREIFNGCRALRLELKSFDSAWLRGFFYGNDYNSCLKGDVAERIRFWFRPLNDVDGMPRDQYQTFERQFIDGCETGQLAQE